MTRGRGNPGGPEEEEGGEEGEDEEDAEMPLAVGAELVANVFAAPSLVVSVVALLSVVAAAVTLGGTTP